MTSKKSLRTLSGGISVALRGIRKAKEHAIGAQFNQLHRVESMLVTAQGRKKPRRDKPKGDKQKGKTKGGAKKKA